MLSVGIIGGGFCGMMTMVHLVRTAREPLRIHLFNKDYPLARGIAYRTFSDQHLLNVEARNMSAFPDEPDHFINWCRKNNVAPEISELSTAYLPRNIYGNYLEEIFNRTIHECPPHIEIHLIEDEVTDLTEKGRLFILHTAGGNFIPADKIVLATGNAVPQDPRLHNPDFLHSRFYFGNPWKSNAVTGVEDEQAILIIGTGLTMVDIVLSLEENNFKGKIVAMSPHGFKILPHRRNHLQRSILDELSPPYSLSEVFRLFYKHVRQARLNGSSGEAVVDAVRSKTQEIWQQLSIPEKQRFMTHLRHMWGVARHRLPKELHQRIESLIDRGRMHVIAGKLRGVSIESDKCKVRIALKNGSYLDMHVNRVINCTGPQADIRKQKSRLYRNLLQKQMIIPDPMNLGIHATNDGRIINADHSVNNRIFAIGSLLKGKLWESTAVPELRMQTFMAARLVLSTDVEKVIA